MENFIAVLVIIFIFIISIVMEEVSQNNFIKKRRKILTEGRKIVFYECINKEFNDWRKISEGTIVDCRENYFKLEFSDGSTTYEKYCNFGQYDDKVEVYDGNELVMATGFEL